LALQVAITELLDLLAQHDIFLVVAAELVSWFIPRDKLVAQEVERMVEIVVVLQQMPLQIPAVEVEQQEMFLSLQMPMVLDVEVLELW
jgi:hypothetical protein